ncbi:MAG: SPOR domain-containing protein, partial [Bacteroidota bacterium]|nr:SPOR domain-containing protein [Bacteroidota bacterium]
PANQNSEEERTISEINREAIKTNTDVEKNQKVTKKVSIAPGEAVLISARVSPAKTIPAKASPVKTSPNKNNATAPNEVRRNFTIDEINAALAKDGTKAKPESTHTTKFGESNNPVNTKPAPPTTTTISPERNETPAKSPATKAPATINAKSERFYIIVNGYSTYESAEHNRKIIAKKGRPGKIIAPYGDAKLYRIAIAEYPNREQALQNLPALKTKYGNTIWILKR